MRNIAPRQGTETLTFFRFSRIQLRNIAPRQGTETKYKYFLLNVHILLRNIAPRQGTETDGNRIDENNAEKAANNYEGEGDGNGWKPY